VAALASHPRKVIITDAKAVLVLAKLGADLGDVEVV
jgi:hypothetical protein